MIYVNGEFLPASNASVLATDRGFLFGDGVFTTIRIANRQIEFFESHRERFSLHCSRMHISSPVIGQGDILKLIEFNDAYEGIWRLKVIATAKTRQGDLSGMREVGTHVILLEPYVAPLKEGCILWAYPKPVESPLSSLKTLGCASRFFILEESHRAGCDDALMKCSEGFVTETAFANFFWRLGSDLFTPSSTLPLMSGLALTFIKMAAEDMRCNWHEVRVSAAQIPNEAQLFVCNSMTGIVPVESYHHISFRRDFSFESMLKARYDKIRNNFSLKF
ncbi:MAG: aminotransferase class IV [Parachlamydiaceae bacterium]|nr:aminotransferase class IV [Parachlamydiaceae bacterium]